MKLKEAVNKDEKIKSAIINLLDKYDEAEDVKVRFDEKYAEIEFMISYFCSEYLYTFRIQVGGFKSKLKNVKSYTILPLGRKEFNQIECNVNPFKIRNIFDKVDEFKSAIEEINEVFSNFKKILKSIEVILERNGYAIEGAV